MVMWKIVALLLINSFQLDKIHIMFSKSIK